MPREDDEPARATADRVARRSYGKLSSFLVAPSAMGQRLVRAKSKIRQAAIPFRVPGSGELGERLGAVLEAIYAAFAEGWSDPAGTEIRRRNLAEEGIYLGRLVVSLL